MSTTSSGEQIKVVLVTAPSMEKASEMARSMVNMKLAACVNIIPELRSIYRWQGNVEQDSEVLMLVKTRLEKVSELERRILELHPYDTPEFVVVNSDFVTEKYKHWVCNATA